MSSASVLIGFITCFKETISDRPSFIIGDHNYNDGRYKYYAL